MEAIGNGAEIFNMSKSKQQMYGDIGEGVPFLFFKG